MTGDVGDAIRVRNVRPAKRVEDARKAAANGMPETETADTIGRLWCHGLLDGTAFDSDQIRDAGRLYATLYWHRYGPVCAHTGAYEAVISSGSSGPRQTVIVDAAADLHAETLFRRRDEVLTLCGRRVRKAVIALCVDGHGDNDPAWLVDVINGYPTATAELRAALENAKAARKKARGGAARRKAGSSLRSAEAALRQKLVDLRAERIDWRAVQALRTGLCELARLDRAEGRHRKRGIPPKAA